MCLCTSIRLSIHPFRLPECVCLSICPCVCLPTCLSFCPPVCLPVCSSVCLTHRVSLSVYPSLHPLVCLSVFPSLCSWRFVSDLSVIYVYDTHTTTRRRHRCSLAITNTQRLVYSDTSSVTALISELLFFFFFYYYSSSFRTCHIDPLLVCDCIVG